MFQVLVHLLEGSEEVQKHVPEGTPIRVIPDFDALCNAAMQAECQSVVIVSQGALTEYIRGKEFLSIGSCVWHIKKDLPQIKVLYLGDTRKRPEKLTRKGKGYPPDKYLFQRDSDVLPTSLAKEILKLTK